MRSLLLSLVLSVSLGQTGAGEEPSKEDLWSGPVESTRQVRKGDSPRAFTHEGELVADARIVRTLLATIAPCLNRKPLLAQHEAQLPPCPIREVKPDKQGRVVVSVNTVHKFKLKGRNPPTDINIDDVSVIGVRLDPNDVTIFWLIGREVGITTLTFIYSDKSKEIYEVTVDEVDTQNEPVRADRKDDEQERHTASLKLPRKKRD